MVCVCSAVASILVLLLYEHVFNERGNFHAPMSTASYAFLQSLRCHAILVVWRFQDPANGACESDGGHFIHRQP